MHPDYADSPAESPSPADRADRIIAWLKGRERGVLIAAVGLQLVVLAAMLLIRLSIVLFGQTVHLRVTGAILRDGLTGPELLLTYPFTQPQGMVRGMPSIRPGEFGDRTVYVVIMPQGGGKRWAMNYMTTDRPPSGTVFLRGKITEWGQVRCGIESFVVPEGTHQKYQEAAQRGQLFAELAVTTDGQVGLKQLHIE